jgi:hypothetical protein
MRVAQRCGTPLDLTTREFDLLLFLAEHRNRTVSREMLARYVWQENSRFTPIDNVIDVQMTRLRRKSASRTPDRASPLKITTNSSTDSSSAGTRSPRRTAGPASASPSRNSQSNAAEDGFISSLPLPLEHAAASSFR